MSSSGTCSTSRCDHESWWPRREGEAGQLQSWDAIEAWRAVAEVPETDIEVSGGEVMTYQIAGTRPPF